MIEQGFKYADSTIKELSDFFETRVENLDTKEKKKNLQQLPRNPMIKSPPRKGKGKTPSQMSQNPAKIFLQNRRQARNTASYVENAIIPQTIARIYVLW